MLARAVSWSKLRRRAVRRAKVDGLGRRKVFFSTLTDGGAAPALIATMTFAEHRAQVIANNVANTHTTGYRAKQLDAKGFQRALQEALDVRDEGAGRPFQIRGGKEVATDERGRLRVTPSDKPVDNVLFHDGTNLSLEREMADLAETAMTHEMASALLRGSFDRMRTAIRGSAR